METESRPSMMVSKKLPLERLMKETCTIPHGRENLRQTVWALRSTYPLMGTTAPPRFPTTPPPLLWTIIMVGV